MLKISEVLTKKRNYDFRKSIILKNDLIPDFSVSNFRSNGYLIRYICQVDLREFHFYEIAGEILRKHYFCDDSSK